MTLQDPVAVYNAEDPEDAQALCALLAQAGIAAQVFNEETPPPHLVAGYVPDLHPPQVWVERAAAEQAAPTVEVHARSVADRRAAEEATAAAAGPIGVVCEECGKQAEFPATDKGSVQECPHCGAYIDVALDAGGDEWQVPAPDESAEA